MIMTSPLSSTSSDVTAHGSLDEQRRRAWALAAYETAVGRTATAWETSYRVDTGQGQRYRAVTVQVVRGTEPPDRMPSDVWVPVIPPHRGAAS